MADNRKRLICRKYKETDGAAMVIVLCVLAIFLALSASVLLAGSVALNTARNNIAYEQGKIQAVTLSNLIVDDMDKDARRTAEDASKSLPSYLKEQMMSGAWPSYDPQTDNSVPEKAVRSYVVESAKTDAEGNAVPYSIELEMYWYPASEITNPADESKYNNAHVIITVISVMRKPDFRVQCDFKATVTPKADNSGFDWIWDCAGRK